MVGFELIEGKEKRFFLYKGALGPVHKKKIKKKKKREKRKKKKKKP